MDELIIGLFIFSVLGLLFGGSLLGIVAFFQNRGLRRRIFDLETADEGTARPKEHESAPLHPAAEDDLEEPEPIIQEETATTGPPAAEQTIETPSPAKRSAPAKQPKKRVEWEKLLGVQGAAILGGVVLLFAAVLFFKLAIDEGWFDHSSKVWTGVIVGTLCLLVQARLRSKGYRVVSDVLAGSGAVIHYAAAWYACKDSPGSAYLLDWKVGFGWMILVTAVCCWLAVRHSAQLIAIFGLVGGFATPLLLSTSGGALGLFSYILLLDFALLAIGRRQDWPWLGLLGLFGTTGSQILWLVGGREEEAAVGLIACGIFGLLFVFMGGSESSRYHTRWKLGRIAGVLIPFALAIHYAQLVELGDDYLVIACVATLLAGAATFVGRKLELRALPLASAAAAAGVAATWLLSRSPGEGELIAFAFLTGVTSIVLAVLDAWPRRGDSDSVHPAAVHSLVLLFVLSYLVDKADGLSLWGVSSVIGVHLILTVWARAALPALPALAGLAAGVSFVLYRAQHTDPSNTAYHNVPMLLIAVILSSGALLLAAILWRRHSAPRALALAAVLCALPSLAYFKPDDPAANLTLFYGALALLALISACGAARAASSFIYAPVVLITSFALYAGVDRGFFETREWPISEALLWIFLCVAIMTLAPLLSRKSLTKTRFLGFMAAVTPILGIGRFLELHEAAFGERGALLLLVVLALLPALGYLLLRDDTTEGDGARRAKTAYLMSACFLLGLAIPAELRKLTLPMGNIGHSAWGLVGISLSGALMSIAARRRSSSTWSAVSLAIVTIPALTWSVLLFEPQGFRHEDNLAFNWLSYHYGLSFLSLLVALRSSSAHDPTDRLHRVFRVCSGGVTCLLGFAFINLLLINGYSDGERLDSWSTADLNRDLLLSLAWALYSFSLLALGARSKVAALRWVSLTFLLATIVKVFLFDLGNLEGLQRVVSFLGLAVCLILVSLFYQRFVFKKGAEEPEPSA